MAQNSLADLLSLINQQIDSQELLQECLSKLHALILVALNEDFLDLEKSVINNYLWAISDFIDQANTISETTLRSLQRNSPQLSL